MDESVPVAEWPVENGERVLLFVVHENAKYAKTPEERAEWQGWCVGHWTDFNRGGWVWHGHLGTVTHVTSLPAWPASPPADRD